ncbi:MAG: translation initiation factor IF-2 subunit alpha [Euryarchaeota archaeon]|nr:translation initiation factor IF-2 subunit alpha [Euryarchaeota archaeon]
MRAPPSGPPVPQDGTWPQVGEMVLGTIQGIKDFGAFVSLDEYRQREGLVHISEIAPGWIRNVRDHVKEGQKVVCRVYNVDAERGRIDLSIKDVNEHQRKEKVKAWKNETKARKWLEQVMPAERVAPLAAALAPYGGLYVAIEEAVLSEPAILQSAGVDKKVIEKIQKVGLENITIPEVAITGMLELTCPRPDGIEVIKKALQQAEAPPDGKDGGEKGARLSVTYVGAPRYRLKIVARDYKKAEAALKGSTERAIEVVQKSGGEGKFTRK